MERIESPSFFFSLPFHLLLIFVSSQRGATNLSIHFFPQTSLSKRCITKNYTQNWFSRIKTTPILVSCLVVPPYTPILLSNPVTRLSSPSTSRRDDKNCEILHEPAKPYLSTRMRNERERKRELKSFPPTTWVAKPFELPLRSLSLLNKTLGETHSPSANSESPTSKSFSRIVESSISGDPRIHRQLDVKGVGSTIPRTCFLRRATCGFLHVVPPRRVSRPRRGKRRSEGVAKRGRAKRTTRGEGEEGLLTGRMSPLRVAVMQQPALSSQLKIFSRE